MLRKKDKIKREKYYLGITNVIEGVTHVHVMGSGKYYSTHGINEPEMCISDKYKDKFKPLGRILKRLGLWENGKILQQKKKPE